MRSLKNSKPNPWLLIINIIAATSCFILLGGYSLFYLIVAGVGTTNGGLGGPADLPDYMPAVGLIAGTIMFVLGVSGKKSRNFMWLASLILFIGLCFSNLGIGLWGQGYL